MISTDNHSDEDCPMYKAGFWSTYKIRLLAAGQHHPFLGDKKSSWDKLRTHLDERHSFLSRVGKIAPTRVLPRAATLEQPRWRKEYLARKEGNRVPSRESSFEGRRRSSTGSKPGERLKAKRPADDAKLGERRSSTGGVQDITEATGVLESPLGLTTYYQSVKARFPNLSLASSP
ncbi:hypothetical protein T484DRAFT_1893137, partial [Baffinella frigidus]